MSSGEKFGARVRLIKLDMATEDIHRLWADVPSSYEVPKRMLSEARSVLRSDQKKALKIVQKARKAFQREATVATEYNRVRERLRFSEDPSVKKNEEKYKAAILKGDYKSALKAARKLASATSDLDHPLTMAIRAGEGDPVVTVTSTCDRTLVVLLIEGRAGDERIQMEPSAFTLQPFSSVSVQCSGTGGASGITVRADYRDGGVERSISSDLSVSRRWRRWTRG